MAAVADDATLPTHGPEHDARDRRVLVPSGRPVFGEGRRLYHQPERTDRVTLEAAAASVSAPSGVLTSSRMPHGDDEGAGGSLLARATTTVA